MKRVLCTLVVMSMAVFAGCVTTGGGGGGQAADPAAQTGSAEVEEKGPITAIAYHVWDSEVRINPNSQGESSPQETIKTKRARVDFEPDATILTANGRKIRYQVSGNTNRRPTKDYQLVWASFDGSLDEIVLHFSNGEKITHQSKYISISPRLDAIEAKHHTEDGTPWNECYGR